VLFDSFDFLPLLYPAAVADLTLLPLERVSCVNGLLLRLNFALILCPALEPLLELLDLLPEVVDDVLVLADVDGDQFLVGDGLGLDVLGPVGVLETVDGLLELRGSRTDVRDHHRLAVAAQTVLQQSRQLRVAVRHEEPLLVLVPQRVYAVGQRQQRTVYLRALHQPKPSVLGDGAPLGASQVDEGQFARQRLDVDGPHA
jgi:hypothetical protein